MEWTDVDVKPVESKAIWIATFQEHINLAWYINGRFWPYGGDINDGRKPFGDKHGDCDVQYWKYADIPDIPDEMNDD